MDPEPTVNGTVTAPLPLAERVAAGRRKSGVALDGLGRKPSLSDKANPFVNGKTKHTDALAIAEPDLGGNGSGDQANDVTPASPSPKSTANGIAKSSSPSTLPNSAVNAEQYEMTDQGGTGQKSEKQRKLEAATAVNLF